jgi:hypothetical protein
VPTSLQHISPAGTTAATEVKHVVRGAVLHAEQRIEARRNGSVVHGGSRSNQVGAPHPQQVRDFGLSTIPQLQVRRLDGHRVRVVRHLDYLVDDGLRFDRFLHVEIAAVAVRAKRMAKDA